ncbi:hypothetical protein BDW22DRAFT_1422182 [Trametopsis cervina]|nr:hypothetical protein BDW22DRAFT_1422182 [Trametopsis cervina]
MPTPPSSRPPSKSSRRSRKSSNRDASPAGTSVAYEIEVVDSDADADVIQTSFFGGPIAASPLDDSTSPARLSHLKVAPSYNSAPPANESIYNSPEAIDADIPLPGPSSINRPIISSRSNSPPHPYLRRDRFRTSRSPSVSRGPYNWRQRHSRTRFTQFVDDGSSDNSSNVDVSRKTLKPWAKCLKKLRKYDENLVRGWKEDIDTLLVFAGLFSAVLTAFIVDSYKLLQQDSEQASASLLQIITNHLLDGTAPEITSPSPAASEPSAFAIRINILWFMSLVFSLSSASVGILAKQWLREYVSSTATSPRQAARIRQFRYTGLIRWHVPEIIAFLPVMLQIALALFFAGLLDLLWQLNFIVAGVITFFVSLLLVFVGVTTILPTISRDSPHRSPQALAVYRLRQWVVGLAVSLLLILVDHHVLRLSPSGWPIIHVPFSFLQGAPWRRKVFGWLINQLYRRQPRNWMQREKYYVEQQEAELDHRLLVDADALFMDDKMLSQIIRPCISETKDQTALNCLTDILLHRAHRAGGPGGLPTWRHHESFDRGMSALLHLTVDVLERINPGEERDAQRVLEMLRNMCTSMPFHHDDPMVLHVYHRVHEVLAVFLVSEVNIARVAFDIMDKTSHQRQSSEEPVTFDGRVIENIISYAPTEQQQCEPHAFFQACSMALQLSTESHMDPDEFITVQTKIMSLLKDLETYLGTNPAPSPSPSLIIALLGYVDRNPELLEPLSSLITVLRPTIGIHASRLDGRGTSIDMHRRAFRHLRGLFSPVPNAQRQQAVNVLELEELGLQLPSITPIGTPSDGATP